MLTPQFVLPLAGEIIVDLFAGGGGWSSAFETATGQHPHVAINHDADAISMHEMNHPQSKHYQADIYEVCPHEATDGMPVGWLHLSPDCTHHSQAKGGQPRDRKLGISTGLHRSCLGIEGNITMKTTPNLPPLPPHDSCGESYAYSEDAMQAYALAAYQAGAAIELAGHRFDGRDLIERVMRNMAGSNRYGRERWAIVKDTFAVGSTVAHALCHEFGLDSDDILRK